MSEARAESIAAWATGAGVGLIALMVSWLIGSRVAAFLWDPPVGPTVAFVAAIVVGIGFAVLSGAHLARSVRTKP